MIARVLVVLKKQTSKIATVYANAKQKHAAKVESKIQRKGTQLAASYVNNELRKGTGLMGSEYVRKYAQERASSNKKGVTVATTVDANINANNYANYNRQYR